MNVKEAAKILGFSEMTVIRKCKSGEYPAKKKETTKGAHGFEWEIDDAFVVSLANAKLNPPLPTMPVQSPIQDPVDSENREIIVNTTKALSKKEAERIIKQEEAIRRQRENLIEDGKIIEADVIINEVGVYYSQLLQSFDSFIDCLSIEESWTQEKTKKNLAKLKACVHECWDKTRKKVVECQELTRKLINEQKNGTK